MNIRITGVLAGLIICALVISMVIAYQKIRSQEKELKIAKLAQETEALQASIAKREFGQYIFKNQCQACHGTQYHTDFYLDGVLTRMDEKYFKLYLTKQDSLIVAKDVYALQLKRMYSNMGNSHNFDFKQNELNALIQYLK